MVGEEFRIRAPDEVLADLDRRLRMIRWPGAVGDDWTSGVSPRFLVALVDYWRDGFDWRAREAWLNRHQQVRVRIDGCWIHAVHVQGRGPDPLPLVLTHGWPSSFAEFDQVIDRLVDPTADGGRSGDAFSVVVPSLPGFPFSDPMPGERVAAAWAGLMDALGYERFVAHGGDIGSFVTTQLALRHAGRLIGIHTTYPAEPSSVRESVVQRDRLVGRELGGGYAHIQRTRPLTLAYGLTDSPIGLAAWILDKWWDWSDDRLPFEQRFSFDTLLTNVMLYWTTGSIADSFRFYREWGLGGAPLELFAEHYPDALPGIEPTPLPPGRRIEVPAGIALFGQRYPRSFVNRAYADIRSWTVMPRGGHFPALEEPSLLIQDLRDFCRPLRSVAEGSEE